MSSAFFPTLPGAKMDVTRTPTWSTKVMTSTSGKELRAAYWSTPVYEFTLVIEFLRTSPGFTEAQTLADFYNARQGAFDTFNFVDPLDGTTRVVRFKDDHLDMARFLRYHWEAKKIVLREVK